MTLNKLKNFFRDKNKLWKIVMIFSIVLFLLLSLAIFWQFFSLKSAAKKSDRPGEVNQEKTVEKSSAAKCDGCVRRLIDGIYVKPEAANLPAVAVMIDNYPAARPLYGLEKASLVYEAEVEGYYTRLMAVFAGGEQVNQIGPVRSARPYFVQWAREINAVYAHCGGSPEALVDLIKQNIVDLNEFYNGRYFWRSAAKTAPHNIFTSSGNLNKFLEDKKIASSSYSSWRFKDDAPIASSTSPEIDIDYNVAEFKVKWVYDPAKNDYLRYLGSTPELSAEGNLIAAKNILIQTATATVIDNILRLKMDTVGPDSAVLCQDGICREGEWSKSSFNERTKFSYPNGSEMQFNAGPTWIEVVRPEIKISY